MKKLTAIMGAAALSAVTAVNAFADPVLNFTGVSSAVTAELSPAITAAMPIAGIILAAGIGWKLYKKFTK